MLAFTLNVLFVAYTILLLCVQSTGFSISGGLRPFSKPLCIRNNVLHLTTADFKNGMTFEVDNGPVRLQEFLHVKGGRAAAFVRTKIKNLLTGYVLERTFRAGESFNSADVTRTDMLYTYTSGGIVYFMNMETFDEQSVDLKLIPNVDMLIEGLSCSLFMWNNKVIEVTLPMQVTYTVVDTPPKSNSKDSSQKTALLNSGASINVPMFIDVGEEIVVSTEDRKYLNRANGKNFNS